MSISKSETKQLLERLIFEGSNPQEWAQDVWDLNPTLGESAAKLVEVLDALVEISPQEPLEHLLQGWYGDRLSES